LLGLGAAGGRWYRVGWVIGDMAVQRQCYQRGCEFYQNLPRCCHWIVHLLAKQKLASIIHLANNGLSISHKLY
jgi:hypothetical protein